MRARLHSRRKEQSYASPATPALQRRTGGAQDPHGRERVELARPGAGINDLSIREGPRKYHWAITGRRGGNPTGSPD